MSLPQDKIKAIQECFQIYDKSGTGRIEVGQLGTVVRSLDQTPTEQDLAEIKRSLRRDTFDSNELVGIIQNMMRMKKNGEEELRDSFSVFDREGSGMVSAAELRHVMTTLGDPLTEQEFDEMLQELDVDRDGRVSYEDFVARVCKPTM